MTLTDPFVVSARIAPLATGALDGLRVAVKDNIAVAGLPTGVGNPTWASTHAIPSIDAACVRALRVAGAEVVGKAHTDEFAYSLAGVNEHYGALPNPADPNLTTGGSSSGCASAVGRGLADLGLGNRHRRFHQGASELLRTLRAASDLGTHRHVRGRGTSSVLRHRRPAHSRSRHAAAGLCRVGANLPVQHRTFGTGRGRPGGRRRTPGTTTDRGDRDEVGEPHTGPRRAGR